MHLLNVVLKWSMLLDVCGFIDVYDVYDVICSLFFIRCFRVFIDVFSFYMSFMSTIILIVRGISHTLDIYDLIISNNLTLFFSGRHTNDVSKGPFTLAKIRIL
jgi:hypothetical protein